MISLSHISLHRGSRTLLNEINWTIFHKQHIGIIGANGSGKTTLFSLLLGNIQPDGGSLKIPNQLKMAHTAQETPGYEYSALDFVLNGDSELRELQGQLQEAEQQNDGTKIAMIHARLGEIDAYSAEARAAQLLDGLGFQHHEQFQAVKNFSGGWRVRLNLAQALMSRSDILLLDEPTNHLDLDAILWLERWLSKYPGTLLLISHDRDFLDRIVDHIVHISHQQLQTYVGNYSAFEKQRAEQLLLQKSIYEKQQKHLAHLQKFISRFRAGTRARQAQSRMKAVERMEVVSAVHFDTPFQFSFKEPAKCPNPLLRVDEGRIAYGEQTVLKKINLSITPTDRIGLLGPNGAGKSSLIKMLAGELKLASGNREYGPGLKIGYFAQHQVDTLDMHATPLQHLQKYVKRNTEQELRNYLGSFGFSGDRILEPIEHFSGGEKSRLALALIVWQQPNLLLLDEPTNHLDLEMRNALSLALQEYEGAMVLVSHDRFLLRSTVDKLILVAEGKIQFFDGDLEDYERWLFDFRRQNLGSSNDKINETWKSSETVHRGDKRSLTAQIKKLENEISQLQQQALEIEKLLADSGLYQDPKKKSLLQQYLQKQEIINKKLQSVETNWLDLQQQLEEF